MLRYLSRYTHRMAISNDRLTSFDGEKITFRWRDYAHTNKQAAPHDLGAVELPMPWRVVWLNKTLMTFLILAQVERANGNDRIHS